MSLLHVLKLPHNFCGLGLKAIQDYRAYDSAKFAAKLAQPLYLDEDMMPVYCGGHGQSGAHTYYGSHVFTWNKLGWFSVDQESWFSIRRFWPTFEIDPYRVTPLPVESWKSFLLRNVARALKPVRRAVRYVMRRFLTPLWEPMKPVISWAAHATCELLTSRYAIAFYAAAFVVALFVNRRSIERQIYNLEGYYDSIVLKYFSTDWILVPQHLRNAFNETPDVPLNKRSNHTHADAAAHRTQGSATLRAIAASLGLNPYMYQMSLSDQRAKTSGSRSWFWTKDLTAEPMINTPTSNDLVIMVDVDHYVDMPNYLASTFSPLLIRTFQPQTVGAVRENYSYTFDRRNYVQFKVSGGGSYEHPVWNYQCDSLAVTTWRWWIWPVTTHYLVDRRANGVDHELVLLSPIRRFSGLMAVFSWFCIEGRELTRLEPNQGEFNCLDIRRPTMHDVSIGIPGEPSSANITRLEFDAIMNTGRVLKNDITSPVVESQLAMGDLGEKPLLKLTAAIITNHVRNALPVKVPYIFPVEDAVRRYQYGKFEPEAKPTLTPFMNPFMHACFAPDATEGNEKRAIESRITSLQKQSMEKEISPFMLRMIQEFCEKLVPEPHEMVPVDLDELMVRQPRPSQRNILANAAGMTLRACAKVASFIKREAYATPNDPRVISTIGPLLKHNYSMFIYAFSDQVLGNQKWYAFSQNPRDLADRVTEICQCSETAAVTDFSRYDGHMDATARLLERTILLRCFKQCYHNELITLHESTYKLRGYGRFGTKYETQFARNSGVPDTSAFNTMFNAFVNFVAQRRVKIGTGFIEKDEAWEHLTKRCVFGGDDGLVGNPPATLPSTAAEVNHVLEIDIIKRGQFGITFLARKFGPDVWTGDNNSMCDVSRQLAKFHASANLPDNITPLMKLAEKANSYYLTDRNTPIIGDYCRLVTRFLQPQLDNSALDPIRRWGDDVPFKNQWPNARRNWYLDVVQQDPLLQTFNWRMFEAYLERVTQPEQLLQPPLCVEIPRIAPKATAVVDEERVYVKPKEKPKSEKLVKPKLRRQEAVWAGEVEEKAEEPVSRRRTVGKPRDVRSKGR